MLVKITIISQEEFISKEKLWHERIEFSNEHLKNSHLSSTDYTFIFMLVRFCRYTLLLVRITRLFQTLLAALAESSRPTQVRLMLLLSWIRAITYDIILCLTLIKFHKKKKINWILRKSCNWIIFSFNFWHLKLLTYHQLREGS